MKYYLVGLLILALVIIAVIGLAVYFNANYLASEIGRNRQNGLVSRHLTCEIVRHFHLNTTGCS